MNYTEKYHLPQWEETDRIMRVDFNQMCADMENGLLTVKSAAENGIQAAKSKAESDDNAVKALVANAQATADNAQAAADAARAVADAAYCPDNKPYVVGTYAGSSNDITVNVGFCPSFVMIAGPTPAATGPVYSTFLASSRVGNGGITFSNTGFTLKANTSAQNVMASSFSYAYIAFR